MTEPFLGEIKMFAGNFAPRNFALCDGQLLAISQNSALFSLFGTIYGGDGETTFGLPELRGRIPIHAGESAGPGLSIRNLGTKAGNETATVSSAQLPIHTHPLRGVNALATDADPNGRVPAETSAIDLYIDDVQNTDMASTAVTSLGGGGSHNNIMPFQCINFIVALTGEFPSRN